MNETRDKFLTEAMGECWHEATVTLNSCFNNFKCKTCGLMLGNSSNPTKWTHKNNNFSTWEGFGKLWEWANTQTWFKFDFIESHLLMPYSAIDIQIIAPDRFADELYGFWLTF